MFTKKTLGKIAVAGMLLWSGGFLPDGADFAVVSAQQAKSVVNSSDVFREANKISRFGNYDKAIEIYDNAIKNDPDNSELYDGRSSFYLMKKDYAKAIADVDHAIKLAPEKLDHYETKARILEVQKEYAKVADIYTQLIAKNPYGAKYYEERGDAYSELKDEQRATADYKKYLSMWSKSEETMDELDYSFHAKVYQKAKEYQNAIADYTKAIDMNTQDEKTMGMWYLKRAECYEAIGEKDKAKADRVEAKLRGW